MTCTPRRHPLVGLPIDLRRCVLFAAAVGLPLALYAVLVHLGAPAWRQMGVHAIPPGFIDTANITSAADCSRQGYDALQANPCDPFWRPMNYPRLWIALFTVAHLGAGATAAVGLAFGAAFFLAVASVARPRAMLEALLWMLLLASPVVLLGLERGNNDLVVFTLLGAAVVAYRRGSTTAKQFAVVLWLVASLLKLYPAFAVVPLLVDADRRVRRLALLGAGIFLAYVALTLPDVLTIAHTVPHDQANAYGAQLLFTDLPGVPYDTRTLVMADLVFLLGFVALWRAAPQPGAVREGAPWQVFAFQLGATAFVGSFVLGGNWNYRLVVLLLCVPLAVEWCRTAQRRASGAVLLALSVLAMGLPFGVLSMSPVELHVVTWLLGLALAPALKQTMRSLSSPIGATVAIAAP